MAMNIYNIGYLTFRLMPFIVVATFVFMSFFNWDVRGIVYLIGVGLACSLAMMINARIPPPSQSLPAQAKCGLISLGENGQVYSNIPLSITTYGFTFFYLLYFILNMAKRATSDGLGNLQQGDIATALQYNIPILVVFPLLIFLESYWIYANNCSPSWLYIAGALALGGAIGLFWGYVVTKMDPNLQIVSASSGVQVCSRPSKTYYQCRVKPKNS
jgi:hypothetical protein